MARKKTVARTMPVAAELLVEFSADEKSAEGIAKIPFWVPVAHDDEAFFERLRYIYSEEFEAACSDAMARSFPAVDVEISNTDLATFQDACIVLLQGVILNNEFDLYWLLYGAGIEDAAATARVLENSLGPDQITEPMIKLGTVADNLERLRGQRADRERQIREMCGGPSGEGRPKKGDRGVLVLSLWHLCSVIGSLRGIPMRRAGKLFARILVETGVERPDAEKSLSASFKQTIRNAQGG